jgi:hypothetical protein
MRLATRSGLITTALAIGAIAAPNAQAGRIYSAPASTPSVVRSNPDEQVGTSGPSVVRPNPDQQVPASTPPVVATPDQPTVTRDQLGDRQLSTALLRIAQINGRNLASPPTPVVSTTAGSQGFQFGDAAIGAGVMGGLVLLTAGGLIVRRRSQLRHS